MTNDIRLINGDCLVEADSIESGSVDLIVTDPPYGNMKGISNGDTSWRNTNTTWDDAIVPAELYAVANRILRRNGKLVLFSQEPYTSRLITEAIANIPFSYRMAWEKDIYGSALFAKKAPLIFYEDIIVFSKLGGLENSGVNSNHPLKELFNNALVKSGKTKKFFITLVGSSASHYFTEGVQFRIPTKEKFDQINNYLGISITYEELKRIDEEYKARQTELHYKEFPSVFNLWQGGKYKSNILRYKKDYDGFHPTQKPVALLEDLIRTYSNAGNLVCDLTMGSGSTGVAAVNTGRRFVGIERDPDYFAIAERRIDEIKAVSE